MLHRFTFVSACVSVLIPSAIISFAYYLNYLFPHDSQRPR